MSGMARRLPRAEQEGKIDATISCRRHYLGMQEDSNLMMILPPTIWFQFRFSSWKSTEISHR
jgi:hypothetical protein